MMDIEKNGGDPDASTVKDVTIAGDDLRPGDIIFGVSGSEDNNATYLEILEGWWKIYEYSGHIEKRNVAGAAVKELLAAGIRFLVPVKKNRSIKLYTLLPDDSRKIRDKVMGKLRKLIHDNTFHLTEHQAAERKAHIKAHRRRVNNLGISTTKELIPNGMFKTWDSIWESGKDGEDDVATQPSQLAVRSADAIHHNFL